MARPKTRYGNTVVAIRLDDEELAKLDKDRGDAPRQDWIRLLISGLARHPEGEVVMPALATGGTKNQLTKIKNVPKCQHPRTRLGQKGQRVCAECGAAQ